MRTTAKRSLIGRYATETIELGGVPMPRYEAIRQMRLDGIPDRLIDRWLQGADLATERRRARE